MRTAIVTDSNSGIFEQEAKQMGIRVIPMPVILDEKTYYEGRDLSPGNFFSFWRRDGMYPAPSPRWRI